MEIDFSPFWLTLRVSLITTPILMALCIPLAYWIVGTRSLFRFPVQALVNLPLALPPTVIGFYLLLLFSPGGFPGHFLKEYLHLTVAFSQTGLIIGSVVFSLPFMINPIVSGLESLPPSLSEEARMLGASKWQTLFHVLLPDIKPSLLAAAVLTFAHTVGEFGVALMIGGKIPGKTVMASMVVYDEVEALRFGAAHVYSAALCALSFTSLLVLFLINRKWYRSI
ncbi:MAG: molybdate transporter, inner rane subunit [Fibrobacteres bacterium]|nr:molybdate transporter, inner rane subunit [Fibrobacterota bacterium]